MCYELHDDNGTPDDESDDIIVGWLVMELYDVSLFGGSVITTYFDLDGNEVQESEIDYDHMELINTETLGGIFGSLTPPDSIIDKPEAKNQIPEIVAKATELTAKLAQFYATGFAGLSFEAGDRTNLLNLLSSEPSTYSDEAYNEAFEAMKKWARIADELDKAVGNSLAKLEIINRTVIDFIPIVATAINASEAITGKDLFSGAELSTFERSLSVVFVGLDLLPAGGLFAKLGTKGVVKLGGQLRKLSRLLKGKKGFENTLKKVNKAIEQVDNVTVHRLGRSDGGC